MPCSLSSQLSARPSRRAPEPAARAPRRSPPPAAPRPPRTASGPAPLLLVLALVLALVPPGLPGCQAGSPLGPASTAEASGPSSPALPPDPWYEDLQGHWCERYVEVLWDEGVTDGYLEEEQRWNPRRHCWEPAGWRASYFPEQDAGRGQLAMALVKAFRAGLYDPSRPSFSDVPRDHREYVIKPAFAYVETACRALLLTPASPTRFEPRQAVSRQDAVGALVSSLGLAAFAASLAPAEVRDSLSRFRDWRGIRPSLLAALAVATRLGIVEGYPDRTLRPDRLLKRSEVATLLYRSCLLVLDADPNPFSPDGDGVEDETTLLAATLKNRNLTGWSLRVTALDGTPFKIFSPGWGRGRSDPPPPIPWDGCSEDGRRLPPGLYYLRGQIWDRDGQRFEAIPHPIWLEEQTLQARLEPPLAEPGSWVRVAATTRGEALVVWAKLPGGGMVPLAGARPPIPSFENAWEGQFRVAPGTAPGRYPVLVEAFFADTSRAVTLELVVFVPLALSGELVPNPARPGQDVEVRAETSPNAEEVRARLPGGEDRALQRESAGGATARWTATYCVPPDAAPGSYPVRLSARAGNETREVELTLAVESDPRAGLRFILTQ